MNIIMSRHTRLLNKLQGVAKSGKWSYQAILYPSELRRIEKQWHVDVQKLRLEGDGNAYYCIINWSNAFPEGLNYQQSWYISRLYDDMPEVETFAQELFLLAARA